MAERDSGRFTQGNGVIAAAIVLAALILTWGSSSSQPRYQIAASGTEVVRLDTDSGALIACNPQGCRQIEEPDRAKTFGPLTLVFSGKAPATANQPQKLLSKR